MKNVGRLKLTKLSKQELEKREMNSLKGGSKCCYCGHGFDNYIANDKGGLHSTTPSGFQSYANW